MLENNDPWFAVLGGKSAVRQLLAEAITVGEADEAHLAVTDDFSAIRRAANLIAVRIKEKNRASGRNVRPHERRLVFVFESNAIA
jgi:hypothetical protein